MAPAVAPEAPDAARSPLQDLIARAEAASARMSSGNPNRMLLMELSVALVSLAQINADWLAEQADKPRIILP